MLSLGLLNLRSPAFEKHAHSLCLILYTLTHLTQQNHQKIAGHLLSIPPQIEETYAEQDYNLPQIPLVHYLLENMSTEKDTS